MHKRDQELLIQMTGTHEFPAKLIQLYDQAVNAWHKISSGPLPENLLIMIVVQAEAVEVKEPESSLWDRVDRYTEVIVTNQSGQNPYEAEFIRRRDNGRVEIRQFSSDEFTKVVLERLVRLKEEPANIDWPQKFWKTKRGDTVQWAPLEGEVQEAKFHGIEPGGQIHLKTGKTMSKNEYVSADEVIIPEVVEAA